MTVFYFLGAVLILGIVIVVHEFGHFIAARLLGIDVLEFAVGMGPKVWSRERKGVLFTLRAIPMGGFCKFIGEDDGDYQSPSALNNQRPWKRFIVIASGALMNFVLALVVTVLFFAVLGIPSQRPLIAGVTPGSPAEAVGIQDGDVITSIDGEPVPFTVDGSRLLVQRIQDAGIRAIELGVDRDGEPLTLSITPVAKPEGEEGIMIGILIGQVRVRIDPITSVRLSWSTLIDMMRQMLGSLRNLVTKGEGIEETTGAVGMLTIMTKEIANGWDQVLNLIILISLNLGIMNLLPLPALDGGRLVFITIEAIIRRPIKPELEGWVHAAGFVVLIALMLVITGFDIFKIAKGII